MEDFAGAAGRIPAIGPLFDLAELDGDAATATRAAWQGYEVGDSDEYIRAAFAARYGCEPREIRPGRAMKLAGPIPAGGAR